MIVQKGKGIEYTRSSNAFWGIAGLEREKEGGEVRRRQSASCDGQAVSHVWGCFTGPEHGEYLTRCAFCMELHVPPSSFADHQCINTV